MTKTTRMNWLTNFVRPKIRALVAKKEAPDNLWHKCPDCEQMLFHRDLEANLRRLPALRPSHAHRRRSAAEACCSTRASSSFIELPKVAGRSAEVPRPASATTTGSRKPRPRPASNDAIVVAHGTMGGMRTVVAAFDFGFMGGSMGIAVGEGLSWPPPGSRSRRRRR